jgi:hypothetical protein
VDNDLYVDRSGPSVRATYLSQIVSLERIWISRTSVTLVKCEPQAFPTDNAD